MKQKQLIFCMGLSAIALFASCSEHDFDTKPSDNLDKSETGKIVLNLNADASFDEETRALNEADYRNTRNYTVQLLQGTNVLQTWQGPQSDLEFERTIGSNNSYTIKAFYGSEESASRNTFRVEGSTSFILNPDEEKVVNVNCTPTCGKILVNYDAEMDKYYDDYSTEFSGTEALGSQKLPWSKTDKEPWYVKLKESGEEISYAISLKVKEEYVHVDKNGNTSTTATASGKFTLKRNEAYKLTVKPHYTSNEYGTFTLTITVDETTNDRVVSIEVPVEWI